MTATLLNAIPELNLAEGMAVILLAGFGAAWKWGRL